MSINAFLLNFPIVLAFNSQSTVELKNGAYVKSTYIKELKKTKSPFSSVGSGGVLEIFIEHKKGKTTLLPIVDFHDSGIEYNIENHSMAVRSDKQHPEENFSVIIHPDASFSVSTPGAFQGRYEFVDSIDYFLRSNTIAGEYVDTSGKIWKFSADGKISSPIGLYTYQVGCDHFEASFDYIYGSNLYWAFTIQGDSLKFYKCVQNGPTKHEANPFIVLKRVAPSHAP